MNMVRIRKGVFSAAYVLLILANAGCKKEPLLSDIPEIELLATGPTAVTEFEDSIVFEISYRDGNGDLGENDQDAENLFVKDNRIGIIQPYRIQELAPTGTDIAIQGKLNVILENTGITDGSAQQTATFDIWVRDRAGNQSNVVTSPGILISR